MRLILQSIKDYILLCASHVELHLVINVLIIHSLMMWFFVSCATCYRRVFENCRVNWWSYKL